MTLNNIAFVIIGLITVVSLLILLYKIIQVRNSFKQTKSDGEKNKNSSNSTMNTLWDEYERSLVHFNDKLQSINSAKEYFSQKNVLNLIYNRYFAYVPSLLVGTGILGTFIGLSIGIEGMKTTGTTSEIKASIDHLLKGMSTAFWTSVAGMAASILYSLIEKCLFASLKARMNQVVSKVNERYLMNSETMDQYKMFKEKGWLKDVLDDCLTIKAEEGEKHIKNVVRELLDEGKNQSKSLNNLADDLSVSFEELVDKVVENNNQQINKLLEEKLMPILEDLKGIKEESSGAMMEQIFKTLEDSLKNMMQEFKESISGDTKEEMESLTRNLNEVGISLQSFPDKLKEMTSTLNQDFKTLSETIIGLIKSSQNQIDDSLTKSVEMLDGASDKYENLSGSLADGLKESIRRQENSVESLSTMMTQFEKTLDKNYKLTDRFDGLGENINNLFLKVENLSGQLNKSSENISNSSLALRGTGETFKREVENYLKEHREFTDSYNGQMEAAKQTAQEYAEQFGTIKDGLSGVFNEIHEGLTEYQQITKASLSSYLEEYMNLLKEAEEALSSNVGGLQNAAEEISEIVKGKNKVVKKNL